MTETREIVHVHVTKNINLFDNPLTTIAGQMGNAEQFGTWVRDKRKELRLTVEAAAKQIGISKQYLSVIERAAPSPYTGKPITPKIETIDAIAAALELDRDEARLAAGYAPQATGPPENIEQFLAALEKLGVPIEVQAMGGLESLHPEQYRAILEHLAATVEGLLARASRSIPPEGIPVAPTGTKIKFYPNNKEQTRKYKGG